MLVLDDHILHLALDGVETQTVGHGDIEQAGLLSHAQTVIGVGGGCKHLHEHIAVGYEADDDTYILGE